MVSEWTVHDVGDWLERLGLDQYRAVFAKQGVDGKRALALTLDDFEALGVRKHRKQLLRGIAQLNAGVDRRGDWHNPADDVLDEAAEHLKFQQAVQAWRRPRRIAQSLAETLDAQHADHLRHLNLQKEQMRQWIDQPPTPTVTLLDTRLGCCDDVDVEAAYSVS